MPYSESPRHVKLRNRVDSILRVSGFLTDRKVHIRTSTRQTDLDVCALYKEVLIIVECKTGNNVHYENLLAELAQKRSEIVREKSTLTILGSVDSVLTKQRLGQIENIKLAIAFRDYRPSPTQIQQAKASHDIEILDYDAIEYYDRTTKALGSWTKYEIFKEFNIRREEQNETIGRPALRLRQPGAELYVFTLPPRELLRIAYVYRRSLRETYAYQRMIKQHKIERIADFLSREGAFLPNAILLAFDNEINDRVTFEPRDTDVGILRIPMEYCSSWIVDGQHRLYGFVKTLFSEQPTESPEPMPRFDLLVVGLKDLGQEQQAKTFVDVNDNQTRIDPTLLCDLTTLIKDPRHYLTWPSLLVKELNKREPWKDRIRILEIERNKPIKLVSFAKYALLQDLLGRRELKDGIKYVGPLFRYAEFDYTRELECEPNKRALRRQTALLTRYFLALKEATDKVSKDIWDNPVVYGITKPTGVNASLLVLNRLMEQRPRVDMDLASYLAPLKSLPFTNNWIGKFGGGWKGFRGLASKMIRVLNSGNKQTGIKLRQY